MSKLVSLLGLGAIAIAVGIAGVRRRARRATARPRPGRGATLRADLDEAELVTVDDVEARVRDLGELYGVYTLTATDHDLLDDDVAFDDGENWIEALAATSVEHGPEPEIEISVEDERLAAPHPSDDRDIPVADRGSAGPAGV